MHCEMDSSSAQRHHQEMGSETLESMVQVCTKSSEQEEKKAAARAPADMQSLKCPRCDSGNTKFCYYNNYSLSQPRYFCKSCRRYWTKGGTLRNVPVGGGCRKNKRSSSSSSSSTSSSAKHHPVPSHIPSFNPALYDSNDLSLAIARLQRQNSGPDDRAWPGPNPGQYHGGDGNFNAPGSGLFDAIRNGFLESSPVQGLYYGSMGNVEMGMGGQEVGIPFEDFSGGGNGTTASTAVTTVKQEMCGGGGREGEGRVLWGFPWQGAGGGDGNLQAAGFESGRGSWNGIGGPAGWHGLLNSPLM